MWKEGQEGQREILQQGEWEERRLKGFERGGITRMGEVVRQFAVFGGRVQLKYSLVKPS